MYDLKSISWLLPLRPMKANASKMSISTWQMIKSLSKCGHWVPCFRRKICPYMMDFIGLEYSNCIYIYINKLAESQNFPLDLGLTNCNTEQQWDQKKARRLWLRGYIAEVNGRNREEYWEVLLTKIITHQLPKTMLLNQAWNSTSRNKSLRIGNLISENECRA